MRNDLIARLHRGESCYIGTAASKLTAVDEYGLLCLESAAALTEAQAEIALLREILAEAVDDLRGPIETKARMALNTPKMAG